MGVEGKNDGGRLGDRKKLRRGVEIRRSCYPPSPSSLLRPPLLPLLPPPPPNMTSIRECYLTVAVCPSSPIPRPPSLVMGMRLHSTHIGWTGICPRPFHPQPLPCCHSTIGGPPRIERRLKGASAERDVSIQTRGSGECSNGKCRAGSAGVGA